ncbi:hypothetical protein DL96DRAFT_478834 [Flagelloscypha sp. PMI_526]|nr:hypothetical protein DL96DRAFT_478834 [Flagelloscypha sp. PMI_526]
MYTVGRPISLITERGLAEMLVSAWEGKGTVGTMLREDIAYAWMGNWRIVGLSESRVCVSMQDLVIPEDVRTLAIRWTFRLRWVPGGDQFLLDEQWDGPLCPSDLTKPWWSPSLPHDFLSSGSSAHCISADTTPDIEYPTPSKYRECRFKDPSYIKLSTTATEPWGSEWDYSALPGDHDLIVLWPPQVHAFQKIDSTRADMTMMRGYVPPDDIGPSQRMVLLGLRKALSLNII